MEFILLLPLNMVTYYLVYKREVRYHQETVLAVDVQQSMVYEDMMINHE